MNPNVSNKKCIRHISFQHMKTAKTRNIIALLAISLTAALFTTLFTIILSIISITEQTTFRQVGTYSHGSLKYLSKEQAEELQKDPLIQAWGMRYYVGFSTKKPFQKSHLEVSWCDANYAKWGFMEPTKGRLPSEGAQEAATDTKVLSLLGVQPKIGEEFTMTLEVDGKETTETFTLCGFWEYDEATGANHVLIPQSRAEEIFTKLDTQGNDGMTGTYALDVMFENASNISGNLRTILERHGYQCENMADKDTYVNIGVNWGYTGAQLSNSMNFKLIISIAALLLLILFTGYLIIYNIFQISVSNDIRFYGLLKTIGMTGRQIKRLITLQAFFLSAISIPAGLLCGYFLGTCLTPVIVSDLSVKFQSVPVNPRIFAASALFSLFTVLISCRKPGKMAAKTSPIEALRHTEGAEPQKRHTPRFIHHSVHGKRETYTQETGASFFRMAWGNLRRNRKKTVVTLLSLSLAIVLLNLTVIYTNCFDMDKYISRRLLTDFLLADTSYFDDFNHWNGTSLPESTVSLIEGQGGITGSGRTYGLAGFEHTTQQFVAETRFRNVYEPFYDAETLHATIENARNEEGLIADGVTLYGMEPFCLDKLKVLDGDLSKLYENGNYIAAVYFQDDYGNAIERSNWAKTGDTITIRYAEMEFYNTITDEIYSVSSPDEIPETELAYADIRVRAYHDVEYEVAALVTMPATFGYRITPYDEFVLNAEIFKRDSETDSVMYYTFDMEDDAMEKMENYLSDYTKESNPQYNYESKFTYITEFRSFVTTFLLLGSVLSFIIGLVGILNFLNAFLTSILSRHREFAVLQAVGMTNKQLQKMLVTEGELLAAGSVLLAFVLSVIAGPIVSNVVNGMYWFFTYRFMILPLVVITPFFIALGYLLPLITYRCASGKSVVERLREAE